MAEKVGFVGVGRMGANMARRLKDCGFQVSAVYDARPEAAQAVAKELGAEACSSLARVTELSEVIVTVVTDDKAMFKVFAAQKTADSLLQNAKGKLFINCATVSPKVHVEVEKLAKRAGAESLEACMASSITQAREGTLYLMCGGQEPAFKRAKPLLEKLSSSMRYVGPAGKAAQVKALVNMVMNINTAGLAEGLGLGAALKLDLSMLREVFSQTGANSRVLQTDGEDMQNREHSCFFSAAHAAKDSGIALNLAKEKGLNLPLAAATRKQYERMIKAGLGELDKSGIAELTFPGAAQSEEVVPSHRIQKDWKAKLKSAVPFGLGQAKPHHFRDMAAVAWKNRDNLSYAWKVLSKGVCDGCALGVAGFHDWTIDGVHLCMTRLNLLRLNTMPALDPDLLADVSRLQRLDNAKLRELGRLSTPLLHERGAPGFRPVSWDQAYERISSRIRAADPKRWALFVTSRGVTNEVYYMAQKVARFLGTNNVDNAARLCHAPSTAAMKHAIGVAASTCSYKDWFGSDLVVFFGANPANDQPVTTKYLHEAKALGTKVVLVNPYREPGMERYWVPSNLQSALFGTDLADYWFPVAIGGDIAFLSGVLKIIIGNGWHDESFVRDFAVGFDELRKSVEALTWDDIEAQSGLTRSSMEEFAALIRDAKTAVLVWSMGITQHAFGGDAVQMILNLGLTKGYVGRTGCGLMPIRGHSSVQGGAEMGAYATVFPGGKPINSANAAALSKQYGFVVPDWVGLTAPEMVEACARGELDLLYCVGGNFLRTLPEPELVRAALSRVPLRVHQDIIVTDQMLIDAKQDVLLLPAKTRYEQDDGGIETTTERQIIFSPEIPRQLGDARAEWRILRDLAVAVDPERARVLGCETGWQIREEIARVVPDYDGCQHLRKSGDAFQYGGRHLCAGWKFATADGKAHFRPVPLPDLAREIGEFKVSTRRGKQFNSLIYAEVDPINGASREAVLMNPEDAAELHLTNNDPLMLVNQFGRLAGRVLLAPIARGNLQVHWPEGNVIIRRGVVDAAGGVPDYNAVVRIEHLHP